MPPLFLLLSPTHGMHQYTADLANRMEGTQLVTTVGYPAACYAPHVRVSTPVTSPDRGFSLRGLRPAPLGRILAAIRAAQPSLVHVTGPHLWNPAILSALRREGLPTVHTLHDLDPHPGSPYGALLHLWNAQVIRRADVILVHSRLYRERLLRQGLPPERVAYTPLLHGFWSYSSQAEAAALAASVVADPSSVVHHPSPIVLFFGRLERYKGIEVLLHAWQLARPRLPTEARLVLAGRGDLARLWKGPLPAGTQALLGHVDDAAAFDLFLTAGCLVLPYTGATQSALIAAAYSFHKPVIVARSGALPEYVDAGRTGWVVEPGGAPALAEALVAALADSARLAEMGRAGRAWYDRAREEEWAALQELYARVGRR